MSARKARARSARQTRAPFAVSGTQSIRRGSRCRLSDGNAQAVETPAYDWDRMEFGHKVAGPALIDDKTTTALVAPEFTSEVDAYRNLVLRAIPN